MPRKAYREEKHPYQELVDNLEQINIKLSETQKTCDELEEELEKNRKQLNQNIKDEKEKEKNSSSFFSGIRDMVYGFVDERFVSQKHQLQKDAEEIQSLSKEIENLAFKRDKQQQKIQDLDSIGEILLSIQDYGKTLQQTEKFSEPFKNNLNKIIIDLQDFKKSFEEKILIVDEFYREVHAGFSPHTKHLLKSICFGLIATAIFASLPLILLTAISAPMITSICLPIAAVITGIAYNNIGHKAMLEKHKVKDIEINITNELNSSFFKCSEKRPKLREEELNNSVRLSY